MFYNENNFDGEDGGYVDVHGRPLTFLRDSQKQKYIKLTDIEKAGFGIFKASEYHYLTEPMKITIKKKEFHLHMLEQAKRFLLLNLNKHIDQDHILKTFEDVRNMLLVEDPNNPEDLSVRPLLKPDASTNNVEPRRRPRERNDGARKRAKSQGRDLKPNYSLVWESAPANRPPKNLPANFSATEVERFAGPVLNPSFRPPVWEDRRAQGRQSRGSAVNGDIDRALGFEPPTTANTGVQQPKSIQFRNLRDNQENYNKNNASNQNRFNNSFEKNYKSGQTSRNNQNRDSNDRRDSGNANKQEDWDSGSQKSTQSKTSQTQTRTIKFYEKSAELEKIAFNVGDVYKVKITHLEKPSVYWVQLSHNILKANNLVVELNEEAELFETVSNPHKGQFGVAEFHETWCRCRVTNTQPLTVLFIDYGNKEEVPFVKELPSKYKTIPMLANRCVINKNRNKTVELEEETFINILIKQQYDDGTYLVDAEFGDLSKKSTQSQQTSSPSATKEQNRVHVKFEATEKPQQNKTPRKEDKQQKKSSAKENSYFNIPKPLSSVKNGDLVMLMGIEYDSFAVKTKECAQKSKDMLEYVKKLDKSGKFPR